MIGVAVLVPSPVAALLVSTELRLILTSVSFEDETETGLTREGHLACRACVALRVPCASLVHHIVPRLRLPAFGSEVVFEYRSARVGGPPPE